MFKKLISALLLLLLVLGGFSSCSGLPEEIPLPVAKQDLKFGVLSFDMGESYEQTLFKETEQGQIWVYKNDSDAVVVQIYCGAKDSTYNEETFGSLSVYNPDLDYEDDAYQKISKEEYLINKHLVKEVFTYYHEGANSLELCLDNLGSDHYYIMITGMDLSKSTIEEMRKALQTATFKI